MERALHRSFDVVGGDLLPIVEAHALAEEEPVRLALVGDDPALRDVGLDRTVLVVVDESREDLLDDLRSEPVGDVGGIERAHVTERRQLEHAPALRRCALGAGGRDGRRQLLRARGREGEREGEGERRGDEAARRLSSSAGRAHLEALRRGG